MVYAFSLLACRRRSDKAGIFIFYFTDLLSDVATCSAG